MTTDTLDTTRRRAVLGALALAGGGAATFSAPSRTLAAEGADAELIALCDGYLVKRAERDALGEALGAAFDRWTAACPPRPEVLRLRPGDDLLFGDEERRAPIRGDGFLSLYDARFTYHWRDTEAETARRMEVYRAAKAHTDASNALRASFLPPELEDEFEHSADELDELRQQITEARAATMAGVLAKARVLASEFKGKITDEDVASSPEPLCLAIVRDLLASPGVA